MPVPGVVVGVKGSVESEEALDWALREAASREVPLTAVLVASRPTRDGRPTDEPDTEALERVQGWVADGIARTGARPETDVRVVPGPAGDALLAVAEDPGLDAGLLVLGRRQRGRLGRRVLGSVSTTVVEHARIPVTVVRHHDADDPDDGTIVVDGSPDPATRPRRVVVGVDTSAPSIAALRHAAEIAVRKGAELEAVFAWQITTLAPLPGSWGWAPPIDDYEKFAAETLDTAIGSAGLEAAGLALPAERFHRTVGHGQAAKVLVAAAGAADRLVVGARGMGGFDRLLLGSVSRQVLDFAPCPVTVVRG